MGKWFTNSPTNYRNLLPPYMEAVVKPIMLGMHYIPVVRGTSHATFGITGTSVGGFAFGKGPYGPEGSQQGNTGGLTRTAKRSRVSSRGAGRRAGGTTRKYNRATTSSLSAGISTTPAISSRVRKRLRRSTGKLHKAIPRVHGKKLLRNKNGRFVKTK